MLKPKGRYYELPLAGSTIHSILYSGAIRLAFGNLGESCLNLLGNFEVIRHGQASLIRANSREALLLFYDLLNAKIDVLEAKADKEGRLFLTFTDNTAITVAGPAEYWDFTRQSSQHPSLNGSVSGGSGCLDF
jgi:hypothetical protein